ncbi:glycosyltransferase [Eubacterium limosum]|jgi:glycosyltransferase involved in cell wall biosynthesis|uniref:Glycosyltransferase 2-like domain-containing protein n=1 Tax=Eubacterium limosum TaxID=1736 RepID=A0AAC9QWG4_EUBLI|nr:glycosyltransferase [Eubacterium limosum]ARD66885.1 hypothetical protein B2M23_15725 [Eubacterium limosum]PWW55081.1 glycosyltransferase involved in cell wall biosynthesis [Eubacterium limosum]UQZ22867.1 glycosyltransferase [Eubacterium limosum]
MSISIAMATYNGEKYIKDQLDSILVQLGKDDEIIISDDKSTDQTTEIIKKYIKEDSRIKLLEGPQKGFVKNFENALLNCSNEIIFLCDQDDIWLENKKEKVLETFEKEEVNLVMHGYNILKNNKIEKVFQKTHRGVFLNMIDSSYVGCLMAFKTEFIKKYLPFPSGLMAHDQWIGLCAEREKGILFIEDVLIHHRIHNSNQTKKLSLINKILFRVKMIKIYIEYFIKNNSVTK